MIEFLHWIQIAFNSKSYSEETMQHINQALWFVRLHLTSAQLLTGCSYSSIPEGYEFTPDAKS